MAFTPLPGDCPDTTGEPGVTADCPNGNCAPGASDPFERFRVDVLINGGTRVAWTMRSWYATANPGPLTFTLQHGRTANPDADDWEDVGFPITDTWFAIDDTKRVYGKTQWTHYRILVESDASGLTYSRPFSVMEGLERQDWIYAQEIIRREIINFRYVGQEGYLLKRKVYGTLCPDCRDHATGEIRDPECPTCFGTGFVDGYFPPMPCVYCDQAPMSRRDELDGAASRGTVNDISISANMLAAPHLSEEDVWVARRTDLRWYIHRVQHTAEIKGMPVKVQVEMRLIPFSHQIYSIVIPGQVRGF